MPEVSYLVLEEVVKAFGRQDFSKKHPKLVVCSVLKEV